MWFIEIFRPIQRRVRMYFRQRMLPMSVDEAEEKKELLSKLYFFSTFTAFSLFMFGSLKHNVNSDRTIPIGEATIEKLKIDGDIRVIKFDGFRKVEDYYYNRESKTNSRNKVINSELVGENTPVQAF